MNNLDVAIKISSDAAQAQQALRQLTVDLAQLTASIAAIKVGLDGITSGTQQVLDVGMQFEKLATQLKFATGSAEEGAKAMQFVSEISARLGIDVATSAEAFAKLASASRGTALQGDETRRAFEAIATASRAMGLSTDETNGALLALSQMISKGRVAAEELRGQLGERLPGAFQIAARAMGVSTAQLDAMLQKGLDAAEFLPKFSRQMQAEFGEAANEAAGSLSAGIARLQSAWTNFQVAVANSGPMKEAANAIDDLMDSLMRDADVARAAQTLGQSLASAIRIAGEAAKFAVSHIDEIQTAAIAIGGPLVLASIARLGSALSALLLSPAGRVALAFTALVEAGQWLGNTLGELVHGPLPQIDMEIQQASDTIAGAAAATGDLTNQLAAASSGMNSMATVAIATSDSLVAGFMQALAGTGQQAKSTSEALATMFKAADMTTIGGLEVLGAALADIQAKGMVAGQTIDKELRERISKMSTDDLRRFDVTLRAALETGVKGAQRLAGALDMVIDAGLNKLGVAASVGLGGMSAKFSEANEALSILLDNTQRLAEAGIDVSDALSVALDTSIKAASSARDFDTLRATVKQLGAEGSLTKERVKELLNEIAMRSDAAHAGINSVAEAFRALGMKSREELAAAAEKSREAFQYLQQHGASLIELREAFRRYAEDAIAANGGVADALVQTQAKMYGFVVTTSEGGKQVVQKLEEIEQQALRTAGAIERVPAPGGSDVGDRGGGDKGGEQKKNPLVNTFQMTPQEMRDMADQMLAKAWTATRASEAAILRWQARNLEEAWRKAVGTQVSGMGDLESVTRQPARSVEKVVNVNLRLPDGRQATVQTTGGTDQSLLDALKSMGMRS